jgi:hypothetical protein
VSDGGFHGRQPAFDAIEARLREAAAGVPTLVLVQGEAGSGRTRLVDELARSALLPARRIRVRRLDAPPAGNAGPDVVAVAAREATDLRFYRRFGGRRRVGGALRRVLPDWIGAIPVWGDVLEAITNTAAALRRRAGRPPGPVLDEDIEAIFRAARGRPLALLLDGLERLDEHEAARLVRLVRDAEVGTRLFIVGTVRTPPPGHPRPAVLRAAERLPAERFLLHVLGPLEDAAVAAWLEAAGEPADLERVRHMIDETGGQPGPLAAMLRPRGRAPAPRADGDAPVDAAAPAEAPSGAGAAAAPGVDLGRLDAGTADLLMAAAALGDAFDGTDLARLVARDELWVEDHLAEAVRAGVLLVAEDAREAGDDITTTYRFASAATRAALRRALPPDRRAAIEAAIQP